MEQRITGPSLHAFHIGKNDPYIECVSIIGTKFLFNLKLLPVFFKQIDIWLFIVSFVVVMTMLDPTGAVDLAGYWVVAEVWALVAVLYVGFMVVALSVLYLALKNTTIKTIILPFVGFVVLSALISLGPPIERLFIGDLGAKTTVIPFREILLCFPVEQVFSTLYVSMGFPLMMQRLERAEAKSAHLRPQHSTKFPLEKADLSTPVSPVFEGRVMQFGRLSLKAADLFAVSADEHYVRVQTVTDQEHIRERFSQVISHLPSNLGFQIHRSHWVAFAAVEDIVQNGAQQSVVLKNGEMLPISKARKREFKDDLMVFRAHQRAL